MSEKTLHRAVCDYLRYQYPKVIFNSDLAGSMRLTIGQAVALKSLRSNRGFPDIVIYEPRETKYGDKYGLFIELKREGEKIFTKIGKPATPHIAEQQEVITELNNRGYVASFAVGFQQAKDLIDSYLR
jgi:hypothetical protein